MKQFDIIAGNPPYSETTGTSNHRTTKPLYPELQKIASTIAENTSLIYPTSWRTHKIKNFLYNNGLKNVYTFDGKEIFKLENDIGVDIVTTQKNYTKLPKINNIQQHATTPIIATPQQQILYTITLNHPKLQLTPYTPLKLNNLQQLPSTAHSPTPTPNHTIKTYIKQKPGLQPDAKNHYLNKNQIKHLLQPNILKYHTVSITSALIGRQAHYNRDSKRTNNTNTWKAQYHKPNTTFGTTKTGLKKFTTKTEAKNFTKYINTKFFTILSGLHHQKKNFGQYAPDLQDYTNNNPIFTPNKQLPPNHPYHGLTLDQRLYKHYNLTPQEQQIIENPTPKTLLKPT